MQFQMTFKMNVPIKIIKRKKWFLASCPVLDIHSQGETEGKAKKNLGEALFIFFTTSLEMGTFEEVLKGCGFKPVMTFPKKTVRKTPKQEYLDIALPFVASRKNPQRCHA